MAKIDFIYFDLGKVIFDFDHQIGCEQVACLAGLKPEQVRVALFDSGLEVRYETGLLNCEEFHAEFCQATGSPIGQRDLLESMSDIFTPNREMFPLLTQLRAVNFPIGILSNTCRAHWSHVFERYTVMRKFFAPLILSYEVNSMKPDSVIYHRAIEMAGCSNKTVFFVDDKQENVDGAIAAGMDAVLYRSVPELVEQLVARGVEINL
ncbi:MAG: HAD superfamily hydrolase (TIGR01509 family) [Mariniblastus sp.]|jgi:HAD superfamily hydrolase (TIGR01509 family)